MSHPYPKAAHKNDPKWLDRMKRDSGGRTEASPWPSAPDDSESSPSLDRARDNLASGLSKSSPSAQAKSSVLFSKRGDARADDKRYLDAYDSLLAGENRWPGKKRGGKVGRGKADC